MDFLKGRHTSVIFMNKKKKNSLRELMYSSCSDSKEFKLLLFNIMNYFNFALTSLLLLFFFNRIKIIKYLNKKNCILWF